MNKIKRYFKKKEGVTGFFKIFDVDKKPTINVIALSLSCFNDPDFVSPKDVLFEEFMNLDHEAGHAILKHRDKTTYNETSAEAFASLMHIKRFGKNTGFIEQKAYTHSNFVIIQDSLENSVYYTSSALFGVDALSKKIDIEQLSTKDLVWYAENLSVFFCMEDSVLDKINEAYKTPRAVYEENNLSKSDRKVAIAMLKNKNDEYVYRAGKFYLSQPEIKKSLKGMFWNKALATMEEHEKATGFILNPVEIKERETGITGTVFIDWLIEQKARIKEQSSPKNIIKLKA